MMDLERVNAYMERVKQSETTTFQPVSDKLKVGVDLGTAYIVLVVLDEENNPIACEKQAASVLKDGVVVDYSGALQIVRHLKEKLKPVWTQGTGQLRHRHAGWYRIQHQDPSICGRRCRVGSNQCAG